MYVYFLRIINCYFDKSKSTYYKNYEVKIETESYE